MCGYKLFYVLNVSLPQCSLENCLLEFIKSEAVNDVECPSCSKVKSEAVNDLPVLRYCV